jgi:hypothetical protein
MGQRRCHSLLQETEVEQAEIVGYDRFMFTLMVV